MHIVKLTYVIIRIKEGAMLKVEHLSKRFGDFQALKDVNFTIQPGEIMGLIGQNGAGKLPLFTVF